MLEIKGNEVKISSPKLLEPLYTLIIIYYQRV